MQLLKARVHHGRLVLDEPTDLPEGEVVYLQLFEGVVAGVGGDLDGAALHRELDASLLEADAGATEDFAAMLVELRQRARSCWSSQAGSAQHREDPGVVGREPPRGAHALPR